MEGINRETNFDQVPVNYDFSTSMQTEVNQSMDIMKTADLKTEVFYSSASCDFTTSSKSDDTYSEETKKCSRSMGHEVEPGNYRYPQLNTDITCDLSSGIDGDILTLFPFVCGICDQKFNSLPLYFMHITIHENVSAFLHCCNQLSECNDTGRSLYSCGICDIKYPTLCTLYEHLLEVEGISDFVYRSQDRKACPFNETSIDSGINYLKIGNSEDFSGQLMETLQCSENLDSYSGNESDKTIIDENVYTNVHLTVSKNKKKLAVSRNSKKRNKKVKRKSNEKYANKVYRKDLKDNTSVKQKYERSNFHSRKTGSKSSKLAPDNIIWNLCETDNDQYKGQKSSYGNKMEIKEERLSDTDQRSLSLQGEVDQIDDSSDDNDLTEDTVEEERSKADKIQQPRINRKNQLFPCEICGAFVKHQYLKKHGRTHEERTLPCDQCENVYNCQYKLNAHKKHVHTDEMKFTCDECGKRFKAWPYLKQHRQVHIKERNIQCPDCPMKFKYTAVLRMHLKTHSDQKPYNCDQCGMKFKRADLLATHKKYHGDQKTFSCPECSKLFKVKQDVKKHFKIHLPPTFFCEICGKSFVQKYNMRVHMKTHGILP